MATRSVSTVDELISAEDSLGAGDEIVVEGGTYDFGSEWQIRTDGITIRSADGTRPTIRGPGRTQSDGSWKVYSKNAVIRGFEFTQHGRKGLQCARGDGTVFEDIVAHHNGEEGIDINGARDCVFRYCHSYDNYGDNQGADGFNISGYQGHDANANAGNNLVEYCFAHGNGDDGFDFLDSIGNTLRYCWSWDNGRGDAGNANGFKLGGGGSYGGGHTVHNCVAWGNRLINNSGSPGTGFWWNGEEQNPITVRNCTAWGNNIDFEFRSIEHVVEDCIQVDHPDGDGQVNIGGGTISNNNSWDLGLDVQLQSKDHTSSGFAKLPQGSPAIGVATDGGDIGAYPVGADWRPGVDGGGGTGSDSESQERITVDGPTTLSAGVASISSSQLQRLHDGYNGDGYINFTADEGAVANWAIEVTTPGTYNYKIRFANGDADSRDAAFDVGGARKTITFGRTDGWSNWSTLTGAIDLPEGTFDLLIETTGQDAGNVDQITLEPATDGSSGDGTSDGTTESGTTYHGYNVPEPGQSDWHVPLNENFELIDRDVPVVDAEGAKEDYPPADGALYIARDTGTLYVGDGSQWQQLGTLG